MAELNYCPMNTSKVRTAEDLERKYNLTQLGTNLQQIQGTIVETQTELNEFLEVTYPDDKEDLQEQIDGKVETWYYSGVPSLSNLPASSWTTNDEKSKHLGDLYYDLDDKRAYRFKLSSNVYSWEELQDTDIAQALSDASNAQDTADHKRRIFTSQPVPPYDKGDLWTQGSTGDIKVCDNARTSGSYVAGDWVLASKYTDDSNLNNFVNVTYASAMQTMNTAINEKITTWYYSGVPTLSNQPASSWTTSDEKLIHVGDLYYNQATGYVYRFTYSGGTFSWTEIHDDKAVTALATANAAQDTADGKRRVFMVQPTPPYDNGDLWVKATAKGTTPETYSYEIMGCQRARTEGQSFDADDWILGATDNTYATAITDELGGTTTTVLAGQVVTIMNNYAKFTDLATGGSTTIAGENITTGSIKSANYVVNTSGTKISLSDGTIDTKNFKVDSTGNVTCSNADITGGLIDLTAPNGSTAKVIVRTDANNYVSISPTWVKNYHNGSIGYSLTSSGMTFIDNNGQQTSFLIGAINLRDLDFNDNPIELNISANPGLYAGHFVANGVLADNLYSTSEIPIGTWIDGKKLWRKVFNVGAISSNTITINHGISNLDWVVQMYGTAKESGSWYNLDRVSTSSCNSQVSLSVSSTQLIVTAGSNANFSQGCYVVIEYTTSS